MTHEEIKKMNSHTTPEPDFSKKKITQNRKRPDPTLKDGRVSMLKKSEISFIFMGAALLTLIIFFVFFRPSSTELEEEGIKGETVSENRLEKRISKLETLFEKYDALQNNPLQEVAPGNSGSDISAYTARVERLEAALTVKFDIVTERLDHMDEVLDDFKEDIESMKTKSSKSGSASSGEKKSGVIQSAPSQFRDAEKNTQKITLIKKDSALLHKTPKKEDNKEIKNSQAVMTASKIISEKSKPVYYTVQKGDTLYSIGRKFKTPVLKLKKINNMSADSTIYVGKKIMVQE